MFGKKKTEIVEEPEESTQATAKKLLILYVLDVLKKYSTSEHKLTQSEIIDYIKNDYGMESERKAISRNIKALVSYGYDIELYEENNEGYYLRDKALTDDDIFMIWEGLMSSRYVSPRRSANLLKSLNKFSPVNMSINRNIIGGKVNKFVPERETVFKNLKILTEAIESDKRVMFTYDENALYGETQEKQDEKTIYNVYAVTNIENEYYLAAGKVGSSRMECLRVAAIDNIELLFDANSKIKQMTGYEKGFEVDKFASQFINGFGGAITDFVVKIDKEKYGETRELFGSNIKIKEQDDASYTLDFTANADKVFLWAFKAAEYAEVLEPAAVRFRLKEYFDKMSWKYR